MIISSSLFADTYVSGPNLVEFKGCSFGKVCEWLTKDNNGRIIPVYCEQFENGLCPNMKNCKDKTIKSSVSTHEKNMSDDKEIGTFLKLVKSSDFSKAKSAYPTDSFSKMLDNLYIVSAFDPKAKMKFSLEQYQYLKSLNKLGSRKFNKKEITNKELALLNSIFESQKKKKIFKSYLNPKKTTEIDKFMALSDGKKKALINSGNDMPTTWAVVGGLAYGAYKVYEAYQSYKGEVCESRTAPDWANDDDTGNLPDDLRFDPPRLPRSGWEDPPHPGFE